MKRQRVLAPTAPLLAATVLSAGPIYVAAASPGCARTETFQAAVSCNGDAAVSNALVSAVGDTADNGRCDPSIWRGTAEAGAPCNSSSDCAPTCCSCGPLGGLSATAGLCNNGVCADPETTCCAYAATNTFDPACFPQPKTVGTSD